MKITRASLLTLALLVGCGGRPSQPPAPPDPAPYFRLAVGDTWTMRDARTGALTTFAIGQPVAGVMGIDGPSYPLRITKSDVAAYWGPGYDRAIDYYLHQDADGAIWSPLSVTWRGKDAAGTVLQSTGMRNTRAGEPPPDYILGPLAVPGATVATHYWFQWTAGTVNLYPRPGEAAFAQWDPGTEGYWKSIYTEEQVTTPAYTGPALCARYSEGSEAAQLWDAAGENNAEQWCFARGVGLVRLTNLHLHLLGIDFAGSNSQVLERLP